MWIFPFNWKFLQLKFWKGGSLLYKNNVTSQPTMQWYKNRLLVFRISFWISYGYTNKADIFRRNWVLWNLNTKYYQIFHDIETTNTGIWIRNIVTVLKKINLIYEIQLSIFKEPWHRNNKYESLKIIITVLKRSGLEIIRPAFFKSVIGRSMMLEAVVVVCR